MTRHDRIHANLDKLTANERLEGHYAYSPGDGWTRWVVWNRYWTHTYSTREVEAFLSGAAL